MTPSVSRTSRNQSFAMALLAVRQRGAIVALRVAAAAAAAAGRGAAAGAGGLSVPCGSLG